MDRKPSLRPWAVFVSCHNLLVAKLTSGFDVIICDIHMPVVSGEQVARMIRSTNNHNQNTPSTLNSIVHNDDLLTYSHRGDVVRTASISHRRRHAILCCTRQTCHQTRLDQMPRQARFCPFFFRWIRLDKRQPASQHSCLVPSSIRLARIQSRRFLSRSTPPTTSCTNTTKRLLSDDLCPSC